MGYSDLHSRLHQALSKQESDDIYSEWLGYIDDNAFDLADPQFFLFDLRVKKEYDKKSLIYSGLASQSENSLLFNSIPIHFNGQSINI